MLERVVIKNFKCFDSEGVEIELKPLTIFVGPNGAGKSSVLEAIGLFAQTSQKKEWRPGFAWTDDILFPKVDTKDEENFFHKKETTKELMIGVSIPFKKGEKDVNSFDLLRERGFNLKNVSYFLGYLNNPKKFIQEFYQELYLERSLYKIKQDLLNFPIIFQNTPFGNVKGDKFFSKIEGLSIPLSDPTQQDIVRKLIVISNKIIEIINEEMKSVFYIGSERNPKEQYEVTAGIPVWVGRRGEYTIQVIANRFSSSEYLDVQEKIRKWAERFGMGRFTAGWREEKGWVQIILT